MKIELKLITEQLTEALGLTDDRKVAALIDEDNDNKFIGWCIVRYKENGEITPQLGTKVSNIKELFERFYEDKRI